MRLMAQACRSVIRTTSLWSSLLLLDSGERSSAHKPRTERTRGSQFAGERAPFHQKGHHHGPDRALWFTSDYNAIGRVTVPPPELASFSPTSGAVGTSVTTHGTALEGSSMVTIDGVGAAISKDTATTIKFTVRPEPKAATSRSRHQVAPQSAPRNSRSEQSLGGMTHAAYGTTTSNSSQVGLWPLGLAKESLPAGYNRD
jgi:hypothetical protein